MIKNDSKLESQNPDDEEIILTPKEIQDLKRKRSKKYNRVSILIISIAIVLAAAIIGGAIYAVQIQKKQSIEKQQEIKLAQDKKLAEDKVKADAEEKDKEYKATRRNDCYDIFARERAAYNNVLSVNYWDFSDTCVVTYTDKSDGSTFTKNF